MFWARNGNVKVREESNGQRDPKGKPQFFGVPTLEWWKVMYELLNHRILCVGQKLNSLCMYFTEHV